MLKKVRISVKIISMGVIITLLFALLLAWIYPVVSKKLYSEKRMKTREVVEAAYGVVEYFAKEVKAGTLTKEEGQRRALATLEIMRYSGDQYFFVLNDEPRMLMHPMKKEMNGKLVANEKDPNGKALFVEMAAIAKRNGAGYVDYEWPKPNVTKPVPKTSYVKLFPEWGWIVGSGIYLDDVAADLAQILRIFLIVPAVICAIALLISIYVTLNLNGIIRSLFDEAKKLSDAAVNGQLATRGDPEKINFEFRGIINGVNDTLDAVIGPLNVAAEYVDRISNGDIPQKITDDYKGDFNEIKNNLNKCIDAVNTLVADATTLSASAVEGKLATRVDAAKHQGDFGKIVQGFNETLDAVILPLNEAAEVLKFVAQNDMTKLVEGDYRGDHAKIKESLNTAVANLNIMLAQVIDATSQVGSASQQISSSAQGVAEGTSEQASSLEEVSSSLEEMSGMTKRNAENAVQAQSLSKSANDSAEKGKIAMERMNAAIEDIKNSSDKTAKIVKTIDEIAFQTNLLALNAAVEAARAGEAGKGFAVVAEEVRNLAMRSAEAAKDTAKMIEESVKNADNGVKIADEVGKSLLEIADGAGKVNNLVAEIAAASKEQAQGIEQVNIAMGQMDKVTQANASAAEESASAAEELTSQAGQLSEVAAAFKISRNGKGDDKGISDIFSGGDINMLKQMLNMSKTQNHGLAPAPETGEHRRLVGVGVSKGHTGGNGKKKKLESIIPLDSEDYSSF